MYESILFKLGFQHFIYKFHSTAAYYYPDV